MKNTFVNLKNIINIFKILKDKKIIVWGTGNMAITICNNMPFNVEFFVDNNSENMHDGFLNKKVYSPEEVKKYNNIAKLFDLTKHKIFKDFNMNDFRLLGAALGNIYEAEVNATIIQAVWYSNTRKRLRSTAKKL